MSLRSKRFVLLHAGTLLGPRQPWGLLEGFRRFVSQDPERKEQAQLLLVGAVNKGLKSDPRWEEAKVAPGVRIIEERVSYVCSLDLLSRASVGVVIESDHRESPFFPAKLTDCLLLQKPVLALSPSESVVVDLLGRDYPYRCESGDAAKIALILEQLWVLWRGSRLAEAAVSRRLVDELSPDTIGAQCRALFLQCAQPTLEARQLSRAA